MGKYSISSHVKVAAAVRASLEHCSAVALVRRWPSAWRVGTLLQWSTWIGPVALEEVWETEPCLGKESVCLVLFWDLSTPSFSASGWTDHNPQDTPGTIFVMAKITRATSVSKCDGCIFYCKVALGPVPNGCNPSASMTSLTVSLVLSRPTPAAIAVLVAWRDGLGCCPYPSSGLGLWWQNSASTCTAASALVEGPWYRSSRHGGIAVVMAQHQCATLQQDL